MLGASVIDLFSSGKNTIFFNEREGYEQSGQKKKVILKKRKVTCRVKERLCTSRLIAYNLLELLRVTQFEMT